MIEQSENIKDIAVALLQFQSEVRGVLKDAKNPHFKNRYASLEAVVEAARPGLQSAGIVFLQGPGSVVGSTLEVSTMLIHAGSGQWIRSTMQIPMAKIDPQGAGSAVTYAQRYSLMAALGIPPVEHLDDDAETAMGRGNQQTDAFGLPPVPKKDEHMSQTSAATVAKTLVAALNSAKTVNALSVWFTDNKITIESLPEQLKDDVRTAYAARLHSLSPRAVS